MMWNEVKDEDRYGEHGDDRTCTHWESNGKAEDDN